MTIGRRRIVFLSHAATDVALARRVAAGLDATWPEVRAERITPGASVPPLALRPTDVLVARVHGGLDSVPWLRATERRARVLVSGTDEDPADLRAASTVGDRVRAEVIAYLGESGETNVRSSLAAVANATLGASLPVAPLVRHPRTGVYAGRDHSQSIEDWCAHTDRQAPTIGILFYRAFWLSGESAFVDRLLELVRARGANPVAVFTQTLRDVGPATGRAEALELLDQAGVDVVLNTLSFAVAGNAVGNPRSVPHIQAIASARSRDQWDAAPAGLTPLEIAMNVAIPELDGRLISVPIAFGAGPDGAERVIDDERAERAIGLALRLAALRRTPNRDKRVAVVLTNHNAKASRIANAVGLDSPASLLVLLRRMSEEGFVVGELPDSADELMSALVDRANYDLDVVTDGQLERAAAHVPPEVLGSWFGELAPRRQNELAGQWGPPPGAHYVTRAGRLALPGLRFGNVFVAVQPPRGYSLDKTAAMHKPDLPPPHPYLGLYAWLRAGESDGGFGADAVIHLGKHGSLEWLPGKAVGLSRSCYPDAFLGDLPLIYPFIVDDPGEGAAAKRRTHATIVDHLPPPLMGAELYGELAALGRLVDEFYVVERTDPPKVPILRGEIRALLASANLDDELLARRLGSEPLDELDGEGFADLVDDIHAYLHELGTAPIRDGLHVLGRVPEGDALVENLAIILRIPNGEVPSLRDAIAVAADDPTLTGWSGLTVHSPESRQAAIDGVAGTLLRELAKMDFAAGAVAGTIVATLPGAEDSERLEQVLRFVCEVLVPALRRTGDEIAAVLGALEGQAVEPGPSGAPSRVMAHVLPTGRNFYSLDPRSIPSRAAWTVGGRLADGVIERYVAEHGEVPEQIGISIWGTSAMRTSGDDVAEVLALLGVRPCWNLDSRLPSGVELVDLDELGRPRIDVICRISGFFRDSFPDTVGLIADAVDLVSAADEPPDRNFVRAHRQLTAARLIERGLSPSDAWRIAGYRLFGSPPGAYGAGMLQLMDGGEWDGDEDLAATYVNWGGYAYTRSDYGVDARAAFDAALASVDVAVKNQDNREHDLFDSDDYFQFHGGMVAAVRARRGAAPDAYFGDSANPADPKVRTLREETARVFRSRVVNPKWLAAIQRHGYKGAAEIAGTVDYLFGYDATAGVLDDWHWERLALDYLLDPSMVEFFRRSNPWARRDLAQRLLEAIDRGLWASPSDEMREHIVASLIDAEGDIEARP